MKRRQLISALSMTGLGMASGKALASVSHAGAISSSNPTREYFEFLKGETFRIRGDQSTQCTLSSVTSAVSGKSKQFHVSFELSNGNLPEGIHILESTSGRKETLFLQPGSDSGGAPVMIATFNLETA